VKKVMQISLRPGEKLYVNGAVLRVDRKVSIEFINDVTFLLENHVTRPEDATTPLRQHYVIIQTMMIEPTQGEETYRMFERSHARLLAFFDNDRVTTALLSVKELIDRERLFEALKMLRALYPIEQEILSTKQGGGGDTINEEQLAAVVAN
jgi:flagellar biosynthesis repressor protein FlbT